MNGVALYMAGVVLESLVGRAWFLGLFVIGAVGGSLLSLAINPATIVSVGASGAIMGLLTAAFISSFRLPVAGGRTQIQISLMQMLIPSLLPLAIGHSGQQVDYAAHLGGALSGGIAGWLIYKSWPAADPLPRFRQFAATLVVAGVATLAFAYQPLAQGYAGYMLDNFLISKDKLPKSTAEGKVQAAKLVAEFPRDPRAHYLQALAAVDANDVPGIERALRAGLKESEILKTKFSPELESDMRTLLALALIEKGEIAEAREVGSAGCKTAQGTMRAQLVKHGVCQ